MSMIHEEEFTNQKVNFSTWRKLLTYAWHHKKMMIFAMSFMVVMSITDVVWPYLTSYAINIFVKPQTNDGLVWYGIAYFLLALISAGCVYGFIDLTGKVEVHTCYDIRKDAYDKLQRLSFSYYDTTPVGYIMARTTSDVQRLAETLAWTLVDMMWGIGFMIAAAIAMFMANWRIALVLMAVMPVLAVVSVMFQRLILKYQRRARRLGSQITGAFNEGIMGARTTKTLVREDMNNQEFQALTRDMQQSSVKAAVYSSIYMPIVMLIGSMGRAFVLWQGGDMVLGGMPLGDLVFFVSLAGTFFEPVYTAARIFADLQSSQAAAERVIKLIETEPEITDPPEIVDVYGDSFYPKPENWEPIQGEVSFDHVTFRYQKGEPVLTDFSLHVKPGQTIALVGQTGSGKSTIVNLICRFYEPVEGTIYIDGKDYRERSSQWLHANLGYVLQTPHLFSGTIRENIRYGRLNATDAEVEAAARMVGAQSFISKLDNGYDTDVGEGGSKLSTGEKQLISFARAILADPAIFVLDEATSSIDTETEQRIQQAIETLLDGRTSFIIAHRLSTIRHADRILVIDKGHVIEDGTHKELMAKKGHYYELYTNQFKQEKEQSVLRVHA